MKEEKKYTAWDSLMQKELAKHGFGPSRYNNTDYVRHDPYFFIVMRFKDERITVEVNKLWVGNVSVYWDSNVYITLDSIMEEIENLKKSIKD